MRPPGISVPKPLIVEPPNSDNLEQLARLTVGTANEKQAFLANLNINSTNRQPSLVKETMVTVVATITITNETAPGVTRLSKDSFWRNGTFSSSERKTTRLIGVWHHHLAQWRLAIDDLASDLR